jgi:dTDP-L-rhamnose 4-epimerase
MAGKVLVTGGAGFIGSHLVDRLRAEGADVRVIDNLDPQAHGENAPVPDYLEGVEFHQLDVSDSSIWDEALKDVTHVVHFASAVGLAQSLYEIEYYTRANVMGTASLLQALADRDEKIDRLVVASSMSCYGEGLFKCPKCGFVGTNLRNNEDLDKERWEVPCPQCNADLQPLPTPEEKNFQPQFVYSINKRDQEELCLAVGKAYDIPTVALRFFSAYGPRQALSNPYTGVAAIFASRLLGEKPPLIFEDGQQTRDFVHVSDVVSSTMQALFKDDVGYQALNVGSGHAVTIEQVARVLQKRLGGPDPEFPQTYRRGDIRHCFPDISRAREALDWEPKHQLEDGVEDLVEWVASQVSHAEKLDAHVEELRKKGLLGSSR